jgi:hypothetical protein
MNAFKTYFGFVPDAPIEVKYLQTFDAIDNLELKMDYLKELDRQESSRQTIIETKTSQLVGQTGIIFTILGLFIANYISKFNSWPFSFQIGLILFFLISFFFYLCTIFQATKYLNVSKYSYGQRDVSTVKKKFSTQEDFRIEEIKDLIYSIQRNTQINNLKCNNLMYAYRAFRVGTITGGLLSVLLIFSAFSTPNAGPIQVQVENPIVLENLETLLKNIERELKDIRLNPLVLKDTCLIRQP